MHSPNPRPHCHLPSAAQLPSNAAGLEVDPGRPESELIRVYLLSFPPPSAHLNSQFPKTHPQGAHAPKDFRGADGSGERDMGRRGTYTLPKRSWVWVTRVRTGRQDQGRGAEYIKSSSNMHDTLSTENRWATVTAYPRLKNPSFHKNR